MENLVDSSSTQQADWLSLRDASGKLGVSPATLRNWADEGRVPSYRTPGGHRRFRVGQGGPGKPMPRRSDTRWRVLQHSALGRLNLARAEGPAQSFVMQANVEHTAIERVLLQLLVRGLKHSGAALVVADADGLGETIAIFNWRNGRSLRQTLVWLGMFRNAFLESVVEFSFGLGEPEVDELNLWLRRANEIIDHVCISMLEYRNEDTKADARKR